MKKRNLIVFDIDGTVSDSVKAHQNAFKKSLQFIGVENFNDSFGTYKHHTDSHIAKMIYESSTNEKFDKLTIEKFEKSLYQEISQYEIIEIQGSKNFIEEIEKHTDFGICYATGSLLEPAKYKLESIGINYNPSQLVASNFIEERELIVEKAIKNAEDYYQVSNFERIISFGDGIWDLKTAEILSIEFIGIGRVNEQLLKENGMKRFYSDFSELKTSEI